MTETNTIVVRSPAKVNLTLAVKGHLPGGYHEVESLMQAVSIEDELIFKLSHSQAQSMTLTWVSQTGAIASDVPVDEKNLVLRAASLYLGRTGRRNLELKVILKKNIPVAAGLGGGSSNAAATLFALNSHFGSDLTEDQLEVMAEELGADVPFCVRGGAQVGRWRGDKLERVAAPSNMVFCIVKPRSIAISTPWIYKQYDDYLTTGGAIPEMHIKDAIHALEVNDLLLASRSFGNAFTPMVFQHFPMLKDLQHQITRLGALSCHLTGSGPTLVALCKDEESARSIRTNLIAGGNDVDAWISHALSSGPRLIDEGKS